MTERRSGCYRLATACTILATVIACTPQPPGSRQPGASSGATKFHTQGVDPVIHLHDLDKGPAARYTGRLEYRADTKCLYLVSADGKTSSPIWPTGTREVASGASRGVRIPDGTEFLSGQSVSLSGGAADWNEQVPAGIRENCLLERPNRIVFLVAGAGPT
ncbi:hypothetical protein [Nonomuraea sp. NPDC050786]|uniref:hypothetical protein n=1 Tax=Nonomuraea sp. NPDC050786 TaxID=3154840 RepID=UPI0033D11E8E